MKKSFLKKAFSLIELSIVILVIGILVVGITKGSAILYRTKLQYPLAALQLVHQLPQLMAWLFG